MKRGVSMRPLVAVLISASALLAQNSTPAEPYRIKGDVLGEPLEIYRQNNPECKDNSPITGKPNFIHWNSSAKLNGRCDTSKWQGVITYATRKMELKSALFFDSRLMEVSYLADPGDYELLRDSLTDKFGEPSKKLAETKQDVMQWDNGVSWIHLSKPSDGSQVSLRFHLVEFDKQLEEIQKKTAKSDM
jgi:hypothetical protein